MEHFMHASSTHLIGKMHKQNYYGDKLELMGP